MFHDYTLRLVSRYDCQEPADASPLQRRSQQLPAVYNALDAHCSVELELGTRGVRCEKINANQYVGHVPDAPVMLSAERLADYTRAAHATRFLGPGQLCAFAACLGASLLGSALATGALAFVFAAVHAVAPSTGALLGPGAWKVVAATFAITVNALVTANEAQQWQQAHERFATLAQMCQAHARPTQARVPTDQRRADRNLLEAGLASEDFALQQAAFELLATTDLAGEKAA